MVRRHFLVGLILPSFLPAGAARSAGPVTPASPEWPAVAGATHVLVGTLRVTRRTEREMRLRLDGVDRLKVIGGKPPDSGGAEEVVLWLGATGEAEAERVAGMEGRRVVVFARTETPRSDSAPPVVRVLDLPGPDRQRTAGAWRAAVRAADDGMIASLRAEIARQERIDREFARSALAQPGAHHRRVKALLERIRTAREPDEVQRAIDEIFAMGSAAVPSLVRLMDDRRPLRTIDLVGIPSSSPAAFESHYYCYAGCVQDVASLLLESLVGGRSAVGSTVERDSDASRDNVRRAWRTYLAYTSSEYGGPPKP